MPLSYKDFMADFESEQRHLQGNVRTIAERKRMAGWRPNMDTPQMVYSREGIAELEAQLPQRRLGAPPNTASNYLIENQTGGGLGPYGQSRPFVPTSSILMADAAGINAPPPPLPPLPPPPRRLGPGFGDLKEAERRLGPYVPPYVPPAPVPAQPPPTDNSGFFGKMKHAARRGYIQGRQSTDLMSAEGPYSTITDENVRRVSSSARKLRDLPVSPELAEFQQTQGLGSLKWLAQNPGKAANLLAQTTAEGAGQFAQQLPTVLGTAAGGAGAGLIAGPGGAAFGAAAGMAAGIGTASLRAEAAGKMLDVFAESGVDITSPDQLRGALQNKELMSRASQLALRKGIPIALFDMASAGLAGRMVAKPGQKLLGRALSGVKELGVQAAFDAGGELTGQAAAGEKISVPGIMLEVMGGIGQNIAEVGAGAALRGVRGQPPPAPPPPPDDAGYLKLPETPPQGPGGGSGQVIEPGAEQGFSEPLEQAQTPLAPPVPVDPLEALVSKAEAEQGTAEEAAQALSTPPPPDTPDTPVTPPVALPVEPTAPVAPAPQPIVQSAPPAPAAPLEAPPPEPPVDENIPRQPEVGPDPPPPDVAKNAITHVETVAPGAVESQAKAPWQMTNAEFRAQHWNKPEVRKKVDEYKAIGKDPTMGQIWVEKGLEEDHLAAVKQAIAEGKPVPPEVLADYPDLKSKPTAPGQQVSQEIVKDTLPAESSAEAEVQGQGGKEVEKNLALLEPEINKAYERIFSSGPDNKPKTHEVSVAQEALKITTDPSSPRSVREGVLSAKIQAIIKAADKRGVKPSVSPAAAPEGETPPPGKTPSSESNQAKYDAILAALKSGKKLYASTAWRVTPLSKPEHVRMTKKGEIQSAEGRGRFVFMTGEQVNALAAQAGFKPEAPAPAKAKTIKERKVMLNAKKQRSQVNTQKTVDDDSLGAGAKTVPAPATPAEPKPKTIKERKQAKAEAKTEPTASEQQPPKQDNLFVSDETAKQSAEWLKKNRGRLYSGLPVEHLYHLALVGANKIEHGARDFASWSAEMMKEFGGKIRPHLRDIYARSNAILKSYKENSEKPETKPPKPASEAQPPPPGSVSLRKGDIDRRLEILGQDKLGSYPKHAQQAALNEAKEQGLASKALELALKVINEDYRLRDTEVEGIALRVLEMETENLALDYKIKTGDAADKAFATAQQERNVQEMVTLSVGVRRSGLESGRENAIKNTTLLEDMTLMRQLAGAQIDKGSALTLKERMFFKNLIAEHEANNEAMQKELAKAREQQAGAALTQLNKRNPPRTREDARGHYEKAATKVRELLKAGCIRS